MNPTVLVIDDNEAVCKALSLLFELNDFAVQVAGNPEEGMACLRGGGIDAVVQDMNFRRDETTGEEGVALFRQIRSLDPDLPILLLTAWADLETAVSLVRSGAADYMSKPWDDDKLITTVKNLVEFRELDQRRRKLEASRHRSRLKLAENYDLCGMVYESDLMHDVLTICTRVATADVPVLITGPNGAGKDLIAQVIQANSSLKEDPFVTVNVGALPEDLMEAELFGAEAGAFTGSQKLRVGRFEAADGGTLFLDEIGNLSGSGQMKLLRVLQTGEYERLGSSQTRRAKVRIISATNSDLESCIEQGTFREDLYYRLNVISIDVPPLKDRPEDIVPLARHFLETNRELSADAERAMVAHSWPGNVRELKNTVQRAMLLGGDKMVRAQDLGLKRTANAPSPPVDREPDRGEIEAALSQADGNVSRAARTLNLSRQALYRRMQKFGLER